jgi:hypothetical protein
MAITITASTAVSEARFDLTGVVAGPQTISYADLAAAFLAGGGQTTDLLYLALTATYADREAALGAMFANQSQYGFPTAFLNLALPITLGADSLVINPSNIPAASRFYLFAYAQPQLLEAGGQSARFSLGAFPIGPSTSNYVSAAALPSLVRPQTPIRDALTSLATSQTVSDILAVLRDTQLNSPQGSSLSIPLIYPAAVGTPSSAVDSSGAPVMGVGSNPTFGVCDFAFVVPHSIIQ